MKYLPNFFRKEQLTKMFFLFPVSQPVSQSVSSWVGGGQGDAESWMQIGRVCRMVFVWPASLAASASITAGLQASSLCVSQSCS
jgi:hypothetical protein